MERSNQETRTSNGVLTSFVGYDVIAIDHEGNSDPTDCHAAWLVSLQGEPKAGGYCVFSDIRGNEKYVAWETTRQGGTWMDMGSPGKWMSKHNSGWIKEIARDAQMVVIQWGGTCESWNACRAGANAGISALKEVARVRVDPFDLALGQLQLGTSRGLPGI
jgi:hypothetical protein